MIMKFRAYGLILAATTLCHLSVGASASAETPLLRRPIDVNATVQAIINAYNATKSNFVPLPEEFPKTFNDHQKRIGYAYSRLRRDRKSTSLSILRERYENRGAQGEVYVQIIDALLQTIPEKHKKCSIQ